MLSPFTIPPHPSAQAAAREIINKVRAYMCAHEESELHRQGKMFGVLVVKSSHSNEQSYLAAFSGKLDDSYYHDGFVPSVVEMNCPPVGSDKAESQRLQQLLFAQYSFINGKGESKNLLDIFANEKPLIPASEWFGDKNERLQGKREKIPPSGAGECCAPKLLQYALTHGLEPIALAEFWVGASPRTEIRQEGTFYPPCSGKCVPILKHMLTGLDVIPAPQTAHAEELCQKMEIVYEDAYLIVVNKPAGLLSVPGKSEELSVESYLRSKLADGSFIKAVHRLDQDTSGLLVLAKTEEVYKELQAYFQRRDILKRYEAICKGDRTKVKSEGEISLPLLPNPYDRPRQMVDLEHGKTTITRYVVREYRADDTLFIDFYPLTGRTHQLRVHSAHQDGLQAPILGDRLYGSPAERLYLHAAEICFVHPVTKEEMHFCIPSNF